MYAQALEISELGDAPGGGGGFLLSGRLARVEAEEAVDGAIRRPEGCLCDSKGRRRESGCELEGARSQGDAAGGGVPQDAGLHHDKTEGNAQRVRRQGVWVSSLYSGMNSRRSVDTGWRQAMRGITESG